MFVSSRDCCAVFHVCTSWSKSDSFSAFGFSSKHPRSCRAHGECMHARKCNGRAHFGAEQRHGPTLLRPTEAHLHACTGQFRSHSAPVLFYCARVHRVVTISVIPSVIFRRAALSVQVVHLVHRDLGSVLSVYRPTCCVGCKEKAHFRARAWPDGRGVKFFHGMLADGVRPPEVG